MDDICRWNLQMEKSTFVFPIMLQILYDSLATKTLPDVTFGVSGWRSLLHLDIPSNEVTPKQTRASAEHPQMMSHQSKSPIANLHLTVDHFIQMFSRKTEELMKRRHQHHHQQAAQIENESSLDENWRLEESEQFQMKPAFTLIYWNRNRKSEIIVKADFNQKLSTKASPTRFFTKKTFDGCSLLLFVSFCK